MKGVCLFMSMIKKLFCVLKIFIFFVGFMFIFSTYTYADDTGWTDDKFDQFFKDVKENQYMKSGADQNKLFIDNCLSKYFNTAGAGELYDQLMSNSSLGAEFKSLNVTNSLMVLHDGQNISCKFKYKGTTYTNISDAYAAIIRFVIKSLSNPSDNISTDLYDKDTNDAISKINSAYGKAGYGALDLAAQSVSFIRLLSISSVYSQNPGSDSGGESTSGSKPGPSFNIDNNTFDINSTVWTIQPPTADGINDHEQNNWLANVTSAINKFSGDINFYTNVVIGFAVLISMVILIINIVKLGASASNPFKRHVAQMNFLVCLVCIGLLGSIRTFAYLIITMI